MFMLLLLLVASSLFMACLVIGALSLVGTIRGFYKRSMGDAAIPACVLVSALLVGSVQYQAIRQIVPHISVW